jgi:hypothetical protein
LIGSIRQVAHPAKIGVQDRVEQGGLSSATAYEVSKLEDPAAQADLAGAVVEQKLTRSEREFGNLNSLAKILSA